MLWVLLGVAVLMMLCPIQIFTNSMTVSQNRWTDLENTVGGKIF